jgi:Gpi18-like mannosyltransferase
MGGTWTPRYRVLLGIGFLAALAVRLWLLPIPGYTGDIDQFVEWVRHIANNGLPRAYDEHLSFGPVMAFVWWLLGTLDPAFRTATGSSDLGIRILMKLPGTIADVGIAAAVLFWFRSRPALAIIGAVGFLLVPATAFVSAWWGQYESIFTLAVLLALLFARADRDGLAVVALTVAILTKPQAAPLAIPFAAWFLARANVLGIAGIVRLGAIAGLTALVLWLPFIAAGGPGKYLSGLGRYHDDFYAVLSLNAWNLWWIVQELVGHGSLVGDSHRVLGPLTFRMIGYLLTGGLLLAVGYGVWRRPTPRTLALALAAAALVAFAFLTTMHERYGYAALAFLAVLVDDRRGRVLGLAVAAVTSLDLVGAVFATGYPVPAVPNGGIVGFVGSAVTVAIALLLVREVLRPEAAAIGAGTPPDTSAGSGVATSSA